MLRKFAAALAVLSLSACGAQEDAPPAEETALPDFPEPTAVAGGIPAPMQGRWGIVPEDCTSTRGDAKGLIVVNAGTIKFYESLATLAEVKETSDTSFVGTFGFTGEGQEWTVDEQLVLREDGKLVRSEQGEGAMAGSLVYAACDAGAGDEAAAG